MGIAGNQRPAVGDSIDLAESILADLRKRGLPASPSDFDVWFSYRADANPALKAAADALLARGALTAADVERLQAEHLSPFRLTGGDLDTLNTRLSARLRDALAALDTAIASSAAHQQHLRAGKAALTLHGAPTAENLAGVIDGLLRTAHESRTRNGLVAAHLETVAREVRMVQQRLRAARALAQTDPLTGLPSRGAFRALLGTAIAETARTDAPLAVLLCDLDYFRAVDDGYGRLTADRALRTVALLLRTHCRDGSVARIGGDSFAALLPGYDREQAAALGERIRQAVMGHSWGEDGLGRMTMSIGVASSDRPHGARLLDEARRALRVAKSEGRNRVVEMTADGPVWPAARRA